MSNLVHKNDNGLLKKLGKLFDEYIPQLDRRTLIVILISTICLLLMQYLGNYRIFKSHIQDKSKEICFSEKEYKKLSSKYSIPMKRLDFHAREFENKMCYYTARIVEKKEEIDPALYQVFSKRMSSLYDIFKPESFFGEPVNDPEFASKYSTRFTLPSSLYWSISCLFFCGIIPFFIGRVFQKIPLRNMGLGLPRIKDTLIVLIILVGFIPFLIAAVHLVPDLQETYPLCKEALYSWQHLLVYEIGFLLYWIGWEGIFRGYMLFTLEEKYGDNAILWQLLPFIFMKINKPWPETFIAIIAALALGVIALRSRSIWLTVILHFAAALTVDITMFNMLNGGSYA